MHEAIPTPTSTQPEQLDIETVDLTALGTEIVELYGQLSQNAHLIVDMTARMVPVEGDLDNPAA